MFIIFYKKYLSEEFLDAKILHVGCCFKTVFLESGKRLKGPLSIVCVKSLLEFRIQSL